MKTNQEIKEMVKQKYAEIALSANTDNAASCCGATASCGGDEVYNIMTDDYSSMEGYQPDADLSLGCGLPTQFAKIKKGDTVIDLGSGAGNDAFVARHECGPEGRVIGVDFTEAMIQKARTNSDKLGFNNVEFRQGDIEKLPITTEIANVIVSNCVLNLVPNKEKVFAEMFRVLKPNGHFSVSDIVLVGELPEKWKSTAEMYAGCVSGAIQKEEFINFAKKAGFENLTVQKEKAIVIPDSILENYFTKEEIATYKKSGTGIYSITLYGEKKKSCSGPDCCN